jgi:Leucine-rich repeat (LRR) protein
MKRAVIYICALLIANVGSDVVTCQEGAYGFKNSCTINGYSSKLAADEEFELNPVYVKDDITNLKFTDSHVSNIPMGIFIELQFVQILDLSDSHVANMSQETFTFGYNLRELILARNFLTELTDLVFDFADNLQQIDLSHNQIRTIGANALVNLKKLESIDLSHNYITIESSTVFPTHITKLNLDFNQITKFSVNELTNIEQISLNNNELTGLKLNSYLQSLQADNNNLESQNLVFSDTSNLISLSIKSNQIANFNVVNYLSSLTYLDLSHNSKNITPGAFQNLTNLKTLILKSVQLNQFDIELFSDLHDLETLDISSNNLNFIDFSSLSRLEKLKYLNLNNNNLNTLTFNEFDYLFPELESIDISENNWVCSHLIDVLTKLKQLKIKIVIDDANLIKTETNIRGIRCTCSDGEQIGANHELDLSTTSDIESNSELNQVLNNFRNDNIKLKLKLNEIWTKLNDDDDARPNYNIDDLNIMIDRLKSEFNIEMVETQSADGNKKIVKKLDDMEMAITKKIDSNFNELYDIRLYMMAAAQVVAIAFIVGVLFVIYRKFGRQNKYGYNYYSNTPIDKTETSKEEQKAVLYV